MFPAVSLLKVGQQILAPLQYTYLLGIGGKCLDLSLNDLGA